MITSKLDWLVDRDFPGAAADGYDLTSPLTPDYNCIAWAAGDTAIPWWPLPHGTPGVYWPPLAPAEHTLSAFTQAYATLGYKDCKRDGSLELRYEKIAIYVGPDGKPQHAARQLADGLWTSKLGGYRDIHHTTPSALASSPANSTSYGSVAKYMKRRRKREHECLRTPDIHDIIPPEAFEGNGCLLGFIPWRRE